MTYGVYDNGIRYTVVSGSSLTGLYAADGSYNVVLDDTTYKGLYHPCGAWRVSSASSGGKTFDPSGAYYLDTLLGTVRPSWADPAAKIAVNPFTQQAYVAGTGYVAWSSLLTVARAFSRIVEDSAGNETTVGSNLPALSDLGWQSTWESRKQYLLYSDQVGFHGPWNAFTSGAGTVNVTLNGAIAPNGTMTASIVTVSRAVATEYAELYQLFTGTAAAYSAGLKVKAATAGDVGKVITIGLHNGTAVVAKTTLILQATWQRVPLQNVTLAASANCQFFLGHVGNSASQVGSVSFIAARGEVQLGATLGPTIASTSAQVTQPAEVVSATGALATLLARSTAAVAIQTNSSDLAGVAKTLIDANGTVLLGINSSKKAISAVGGTLASSNVAAWLGVNNVGFAWDASGGQITMIGVNTTDAVARTPSGPFTFFSTAGANFWNGNIGIMNFYETKQAAPQVSMPSGFRPGFVPKYAGSVLPGSVLYRDFSGLVDANSGNPLYLQNSGTYNAAGTNTPYITNSSKVGSTFYAPTEGAIAGQSDRAHSWRNINLYTGSSPTSWTPDASNPIITATIGGQDDHYTLHPSLTKDFAGGAAFTLVYSARDTSGTSRIFWATSPTGLPGSWTKRGVAVDVGASWPNPALPWLLTVGNTVYMYVCNNDVSSGAILVFTSPVSGDGSAWTYAGVALTAPVAGDWDYGVTGLLDPTVLLNKHGWYELGYTAFFSGQPSNLSQFVGYAVSDSPLGPFIRSPNLLLSAQHLAQVGDAVLYEDTSAFTLLRDEDDASSTSQPYVQTLPPY